MSLTSSGKASGASFADSDSPFLNRKIRLIPYARYQGAINMALDSYFAEICRAESDIILRFYGWSPYCLSLGRHQDIKLIDPDRVRAHHYDVVRRPTGGSAIFHSDELTYSVISPLDGLSHHDIYRAIHEVLASTLLKLGYPVELHSNHDSDNYLSEGRKNFACFNRPAHTEIKYKNRKIVGSAQKIYRNAVLQHGSILIGDSQLKIIDFLQDELKARREARHELEQNSASLSRINPRKVSAREISEAITREFRTFGNILLYSADITDDELQQAKSIANRFNVPMNGNSSSIQ